jgi:hypothetical protein
MQKIDIGVRQLVDMIERGELRLPEMQRRYVWRASRVRDLFDSLYRGYPTGSILVWETDQEAPTRELAVAQEANPFSGYKLLLDGQQRLTSLAAVMRDEPINVRGRKKPIEILFNLDHPEGPPQESTEVVADQESLFSEEDEPDNEVEMDEVEAPEVGLQERLSMRTFVVASKSLERQRQWVSVSEVFKESVSDWQILKSRVKSPEDPKFEVYSQRLQRLRKIRDYVYVMHVLDRKLSYEEVAQIFVRVNSLGVKLRGSDLALALITARWHNSLKLLEDFQEECEEKLFTLDLGLLVRAMVVFATRQSRFRTVGSIPMNRFKEGWEETKDGLRFAVNFLRANADIEDESLLSSPLLIIPIAVFSRLKSENISKKERQDLMYWLHVANAKGHYSYGSSETLLDADLSILFNQGTPENLLEPLRRQFGRLQIESSDLAGRGANSSLFSMAFLTLKATGAKDWQSGLGISLTHQGKLHFVQFHHIFPKSLLAKTGYEKQEINEIANMAFISGHTNRRLSNKEPVAYFPDIIKKQGEEALASQAIPLDPRLHRFENYREFLGERRKMLAELINRHILAEPAGIGRDTTP